MRGMINPYVAGSPVRDPTMFFGRHEIMADIRHNLLDFAPSRVVVLHGQRRVGKTSILYQLRFHLPSECVTLLLDLQGMRVDGVTGLLWEVAQGVRRGLRRALRIVTPRPERQNWLQDPDGRARSFFGGVESLMEGRRLVLMFDETTLIAEKVGRGILEERAFSIFADLMTRYSFMDFVFSLGSEPSLMEQELSGLPRPIVYREVGFLEREAARELIVEPVRGVVEYEPQAVERILKLTSGQPYYTQLLCHELFNYVSAGGRRKVGVADVEAVLPRVVEVATAQLHYLWDRTPPTAREVLFVLAEAVQRGVMVSTRSHLERLLAGHDPSDVQDALDNLSKRYIITGRPPFSFRVDLFRRWILQHGGERVASLRRS